MKRFIKDQTTEKKVFAEQLTALKQNKTFLKADIIFFALCVIAIFYVSLWSIIPAIFYLIVLRNHFVDYRFNRAVAIMLETTSSFNVSEKEKEIIYNF